MLVLNEKPTKTEQYRIQLEAHATTQAKRGRLQATSEGGLADPVTGEVFESLHCSPSS